MKIWVRTCTATSFALLYFQFLLSLYLTASSFFLSFLFIVSVSHCVTGIFFFLLCCCVMGSCCMNFFYYIMTLFVLCFVASGDWNVFSFLSKRFFSFSLFVATYNVSVYNEVPLSE